MGDRRLQVSTRQVKLILADSRALSGELFLQLFSVHGTGPQRLAELINGDELFLPLRTTSRVQLVNIEQVVSLSCADPKERHELMTFGTCYQVRVIPLAGEMIEANIYVNLPESRNRVKDFLNQADRFLPLVREKEIVYLNPRHILLVED